MTASNAVDHGPTSGYAVANIVRLRGEQRLSLEALSAKLSEIGRPILPTGLSRMERGQRRLDVDDLMGFALALGVPPWRLLLPPEQEDPVNLTSSRAASWAEARRWITEIDTVATDEAPWCGQCGCLIGDFDVHANACFGPAPST